MLPSIPAPAVRAALTAGPTASLAAKRCGAETWAANGSTMRGSWRLEHRRKGQARTPTPYERS